MSEIAALRAHVSFRQLIERAARAADLCGEGPMLRNPLRAQARAGSYQVASRRSGAAGRKVIPAAVVFGWSIGGLWTSLGA
jgi:hypothetical protein